MTNHKAFLLAVIVLMSSSIAGLVQTEQERLLSETAESGKSYSAGMPLVGLSEPDVFPGPNSYPDFNGDKIVNFVDFARFAGNWQKSGSGLDGDFDNSGTVDANDLATFAYFFSG